MTNNQLTDDRLVKILSETQATIMEHNSRCVRGSVEVDARLFESMLMELQERRKAAMDSEPVAVVEPSDYVTAAQLVGEGPSRKAVHELYEGALRIGDKLYRHAQPAPEYPEVLPCPVLLEPGLRFGKGIKTSTMLAALARRAVYESDLAALSPEEKAEFQAGIEDVKALIAQPAPLVPDGYVMVPKEPTDEMIAAAMNCEDVLFNSDDSFCVQFGNIYEAMLAAAPQEVKGE
ncbi:TPA: hypothetical protein ACXP17_000553 [Klebsiella variicola subsp. variicola]